MHLSLHPSFIGKWQQRRTAKNLGAAIAKGNEPGVVKELVSIFRTSADQMVHKTVEAGLSSLKDQKCIDIFCSEVMAVESSGLKAIAVGCGYYPSELPVRVLFYFLTGDVEQMLGLDPSPHHHLYAGYIMADPNTKARCLRRATEKKFGAILAGALLGPGIGGIAQWTPGEWNLILNVLSDNCEWERLWNLLFSAPQPLAISIVNRLETVGWTPSGDESLIRDRLVVSIPAAPGYPVHEHLLARTIGRQENQITRLAYSLDGKLLAAAGTDGMCRVWRTETGILLFSRHIGSGAPRSLVFTPDSKSLECLGDDGVLRSFDSGDGHPVENTRQDPCGLSLFNDMGHPERWRKLIDAHSWKTGVMDCTGSTLAVAGNDHQLWVWISPDARPICIPLDHREPGTCTITPDNSRILVGCTNGIIRIFSLKEGVPEREFRAHTGSVVTCACAPDGTTLASAGQDGFVRIFRIPSGDRVHSLSVTPGSVTCVSGSPDGSSIAIGYSDGIVRFSDPSTGEITRIMDMYTNSVSGLALSPDGALLACAGRDRILRIWQLSDGTLVSSCEGCTSVVGYLAFIPDCTRLVSGEFDGKIRYWKVLEGHLISTCNDRSSSVTFCSAPITASFVAIGHRDTHISIRDLISGCEIYEFNGGWHEMTACALSPDGQSIALGSKDGSIGSFSLPDGSPDVPFPKMAAKVTALVFTSDGELLIAGYETGIVTVFAVADRSIVQNIPGHSGAVRGLVLAYGEDEPLLVSYGDDGAIKVWHLPITESPGTMQPDDISRIAGYIRDHPDDPGLDHWRFLLELLHGRFRYDIGLCPSLPDAGMYDIQIVG